MYNLGFKMVRKIYWWHNILHDIVYIISGYVYKKTPSYKKTPLVFDHLATRGVFLYRQTRVGPLGIFFMGPERRMSSQNAKNGLLGAAGAEKSLIAVPIQCHTTLTPLY